MIAPSSTSSSNRPIPEGRWLRDWGVALILVSLFLFGLEAHWRASGFFPTVPDSPEVWALERAAVQPDSTVFVGSSKTQAAIDLATWRRATGEDVRQLSIVGSSIGPTLADLVADTGFHGTVVAEYVAVLFASDPSGQKTAQRFVDRARRAMQGPAEKVEASLGVGLHSAATFRRTALLPLELYRSRGRASAPRPGRFRMGADRQLRVYFDPEVSGPPMPSVEELKNAPRFSREELLERVDQVAALTAPLRERGGRLVFLRPPTSGGVLAREDAVFPDDSVFEALGEIPGAVAIDGRPGAGFPLFTTLDGSHLAAQDAPVFTREVLRRLPLARRSALTGKPEDGLRPTEARPTPPLGQR